MGCIGGKISLSVHTLWVLHRHQLRQMDKSTLSTFLSPSSRVKYSSPYHDEEKGGGEAVRIDDMNRPNYVPVITCDRE